MEGCGECGEKTSTNKEIQGQWQHESPAKEYLEQVKYCEDTDCTPRMMKQCFSAWTNGEW